MIDKYIICTQDRMERNSESYKEKFKEFEVFCAIEPKVENLEKLLSNETISLKTALNLKNKFRNSDLQMNYIGSVGCSLSHIELWKMCVKANKPFLIVEDDVVPSDNLFFELDEVVDLLKSDNYFIHLLGWTKVFVNMRSAIYTSSSKTLFQLPNSHPPFPCGTQAYLVTPKVAKILLKHAFPISFHVDAYITIVLSYFSSEIDSYYVHSRKGPFKAFKKEGNLGNCTHYVAPNKTYSENSLESKIIFFIETCFKKFRRILNRFLY